MPQAPSLDPSLRELLEQLRSRVRRYIVWDSVLAIAAVVLIVFWAALAIDYLPVRIGGTEMPRSARGFLLLALVGLIAAIVIVWLLGRLQRPLPDDSLALLIERHHPELGGRLVTAVQLSEPARAGDSHSPLMLARVHREAASVVSGVDLQRIFRWQPIRHKATVVVPLALAAVVLAVTSPQTFGLAVSRLSLLSDSPWPRRASLEMVGIESPVISADESDAGRTRWLAFEDGVVSLARGSNTTLRIRAADESRGHLVPEVCTLTYIDDAGNRGQSNLRRVGRVEDGYQSFMLDGAPLASLSESLTLTIRGLDDRLTGFRIEAVEPPAISGMQMQIRYPDYLRLFADDTAESTPAAGRSVTFDQTLDYQAGVRVREGSQLVLRGTSSQPLGELDVNLSDGESASRDSAANADSAAEAAVTVASAVETVAAELDEDRMGFTLTLDDVQSPLAIRMVPRDPLGISAQVPYRYFIGVVRDEAPQSTMRLRGIGSAVTPIARIPIEATASDDYGVASLVLSVQTQRPATATETLPEEAATELTIAPELDREGAANLAVDLRDLVDAGTLRPLPPESVVQLFMTVSDRFDLAEPHEVRGELVRLQVVPPETLLATLERRELEFRSRLEQSIDETQRLRQTLSNLRNEGIVVLRRVASDEKPVASESAEVMVDDDGVPVDSEVDASADAAESDVDSEARDRARLRLRIRQSELQVAKTTEELLGIVGGLDDLLLEMVNNRVDSIDRRERLAGGVRDPLRRVAEEPLVDLRRQIVELERKLIREGQSGNSESAAQELGSAADLALQTTDQVLLALGAVLEKMLELESFNEILDIVRGLIDDQEKILEKTTEEQKKRVLDLFK